MERVFLEIFPEFWCLISTQSEWLSRNDHKAKMLLNPSE